MGLPILTALFALGVGISLITIGTHVFDTANFAPVLAAMIGLGVGIDYALFILTRFRNALDEGLEPREAAIARDRHRRARGAVRRDHRDHLADGDAPARDQLPLRGGGRGGARGPVHDDRRPHPAAGDAHLGRAPGRQAADPRARLAQDEHRRKQLVVPLEPPDPAAAGAGGDPLRRLPADPLHPGAVAAPRRQRRRHQPLRDDDARSLRPARRRLRARLQRAADDGRGAARQGRGPGLETALRNGRQGRKRGQRHPGRPQPGEEHRDLRRLPGNPRRRAPTRRPCSTTSATT